MLQPTSRAAELFLMQPPREQRHPLRVIMEKAAWKDGALQATPFEPFEILRHSNQASARKENGYVGSGQDLGIWLPGMDSNRDARRQSSLFYPTETELLLFRLELGLPERILLSRYLRGSRRRRT